MRYIGDIHCNEKLYSKALLNCDESIQVGDYGVGFMTPAQKAVWPAPSNSNHRYIRGNHDSPELARADPLHIPSGKFDLYPDHFFFGGGYSTDFEYRIEGVSWWRDEEHSVAELNALLDSYIAHRPRVMVSHEAPYSIVRSMFPMKPMSPPSSTSRALEACFEAYQPEIWFFGHWHETATVKQGDCLFICLGEGEWADVES